MKSHQDGIWTLSYPLQILGIQLGRRVCVMRIPGDRLVIHSTGPFSKEDVDEIEQLGNVAFLLDATTMHDTFSHTAQRAFPNTTYLVPEGFPRKALVSEFKSIRRLNVLTEGAVQVIRLGGMRFLNEYACFHEASRTLIVCDLLFNLDQASVWTRFSMRYLMGVKQWPAIDRPVRLSVKDPEAFMESIHRILQWDFDRVVVAHGSIIETGGKEQFRDAIQRAGFQCGD